MERDGYTCQSCGDTETTLHVHHLEYYKNTDPWDYPDDRLITLCEFCHKCEGDFMKGNLDCFVKLAKESSFPVVRMFNMANIFSWLHTNHNDFYNSIKSQVNELMEKDSNGLIDFKQKIS